MEVDRARALLGVDSSASAEQIENALRARARHAHPDRGGSDEEMSDLLLAREALLAALAKPAARPLEIFDVLKELARFQQQHHSDILLERQLDSTRLKMERRSINRLRTLRLSLAAASAIFAAAMFLGKDAPQALIALPEKIRIEERKLKTFKDLKEMIEEKQKLAIPSGAVFDDMETIQKHIKAWRDETIEKGWPKARDTIQMTEDRAKGFYFGGEEYRNIVRELIFKNDLGQQSHQQDYSAPAFSNATKEYETLKNALAEEWRKADVWERLEVKGLLFPPRADESIWSGVFFLFEAAMNWLVISERSSELVHRSENRIEEYRQLQALVATYWHGAFLILASVSGVACGVISLQIRRAELALEDLQEVLATRASGYSVLKEVFGGEIPSSWNMKTFSSALSEWLIGHGRQFKNLAQVIGSTAFTQYVITALRKTDLIEVFETDPALDQEIENYRLRRQRP